MEKRSKVRKVGKDARASGPGKAAVWGLEEGRWDGCKTGLG